MKTTASNSRYMKMNTFFIFSMLLICALFSRTIHAQIIHSNRQINRNDPNFPVKRTFNAGVITTYAGIVPPPAIVGDITYGASGRLSLGVLGGTTGALALAGLKMNASLFQIEAFRVISRMMIIYYPERKGKFLFDRTERNSMPWMLSMATVDAEWITRKNVRWSIGAGLLETHCIEGMKKYFWGRSDERKVSPFEIFNTAQASVSLPVSKKLTLRPEVITVWKGTSLVKRGEFKVVPINPYLKFIYTF